jgi:uroporphyrinogen-III synthase
MEARPTSSPELSRSGVLITRPEPGASETARRVAALGRMPVLAPALTIAPRDLGPVGPVQAVLVTSSNALPALAGLARPLRVLAVGDATAERARAAGFTDVHSAGRDAAALAALTRQLCRPADGPLLLASGEGQGTALKLALEEAGFAVAHRVAYAAEPAETLPDAAVAALRAGRVGTALFFSPETARAAIDLLHAQDVAGCAPNIEALALSPAVAGALAALPWRRIRVASHPSQDELLALMSTQDPTDTASSADPADSGPTAPAPVAPQAPPAPPVQERASGVPVLVGLAFLVLLGATVWLAKRQIELSSQIAALSAQPPAAARLDALEAKLTELAARPAPTATAAPVDLSGIEARLATLEATKPGTPSPPADLSRIEARLDALEAARPAATPSADLEAQMAALEKQVAALKQDATAAIGRATTAALLARAQAALDAGAPLGDLPGAPPALARFAKDAPPTEAALRLAFPAAAAAAEAASRPAAPDKGIGERMWLRVRSLLTIRHGSEVVVGPPAAETLGAAQTKLDAGDLAGAVAALKGLDAPAAQAMAGWTDEARALLDARTALAAMARG